VTTDLPDYSASRAVLIGSGTYDHLRGIPALNNINGLWDVLVDPRLAGLAAGDAVRIADPRTAEEVIDPLTRACQQASDLLFVYFAGHGLVDDDQHLRLALAGTDRAKRMSSLSFADLALPISDSPARVKLIILDCCYSARAMQVHIADSMGKAMRQAAKGTHMIMSSGATQPSKAHRGAGFTAFTGALIETLRSGVTGPAEYLTSDIIYLEVSRRLRERRERAPRQRVVNDANHVPLLRNRGFQSGADVALSQQVRRDLEQLLASLSPEAVSGTLSVSAMLELRAALVDLPPVSETEIGRIWYAAMGALAGDVAGAPLRSYRDLFEWADRFMHRGSPAEAPVFRCADRVVLRHSGHPAIRPLRTWLRRHRPEPWTGPPDEEPPSADAAAVVVVLHPRATPEAGGSCYDLFLWSYTDAAGFIQVYPAADTDPAPFTAEEAPGVVAAQLPAALEQLARLRPAEAREPIVEFILPEELWDTAVEIWPAEVTGNQIGLLYPTVVRPLDRQRNLRWHGRWVKSWQAMAELLAGGRDVPIVCRSCHGELDHREFGDLLVGDPHHGALVVLDRAPRTEPARAALRSAMVAGAPAFFWIRGQAQPAAGRRACPVEHVHAALAEHLRGHSRDDIPWLLLALRGSHQQPLGDGLALMWDDPSRRPPLHQPLLTPVGGKAQ